MVPTRRFALLAAVVAVGLFAYPGDIAGSLWWPLLALNALLVAAGVADAFAGARPRDLELSRTHPPVVVMGNAAAVTWTIHNTGRRRAVVSLAD